MAYSRKKSREIAFRMIFAFSPIELAIDGGELPVGRELEFINNLYNAVVQNLEDIDRTIRELSIGFSFERIFKTDLAALRMGIAEIKYTPTEKVVAINEAVEIAKRYGTEKSGGFVNGVLARVT